MFRLVGCLVGFVWWWFSGLWEFVLGLVWLRYCWLATMLFGFTGGDVVQFLGLRVVGVYLRAGLWVVLVDVDCLVEYCCVLIGLWRLGCLCLVCRCCCLLRLFAWFVV